MPVEYCRLPPHAVRLLRPQPRARCAAERRTLRVTDRDPDMGCNGPARNCNVRTTTSSRPREEAGRTGDWRPWADLFTEDADYVEHHYGTFHGRDAIQAWITETMAQWPNSEMTEFPHDWCVCDEERGWWICQIENRFRDPGDGEVYEAYEPHRAEVRRRHAVLVRGGRLQPGELRAGREGVDRRVTRAHERRHAPSSHSTRRGSRPRAWRGTSPRRRLAGSGPSRPVGARARARHSRSSTCRLGAEAHWFRHRGDQAVGEVVGEARLRAGRGTG